MITNEQKKRLSPQECPYCSEPQDIIVNGHYPDPKSPGTNKAIVDSDLGYSFCNCRNIFFTNWENMDQKVYDEKYVERYDGEHINKILRKYVDFYWKYFEGKKKLLDIGSINDGILDEAAERGMQSWGLDIAERPAKYPMIFGDLEKLDISKHAGMFGVITASHIFEHFKDPLRVLRTCRDLLEPGGRIMVAMPDPYFIDWNNAYLWGHWHIKEHHIMWDLDSWVKEMEIAGFKILFKQHNVDPFFICTGDWHVIGEKI